MKREYEKNVPNWQPSPTDYLLVFREVDGYWREISNNLPEFANMILADYLAQVDIALPDGCKFCRIIRDDERWEIHDDGAQLRIYYKRG